MSQNNLTPEQIRRYLDEELSPAEMHEVERVLTASGFYSDAAEGFAQAGQAGIDTAAVAAELRSRLGKRVKQDRKAAAVPRTAWYAAAGLALLLGGLWMGGFFDRDSQNPQFVLVEEAEAGDDTDAPAVVYEPVPAEIEDTARDTTDDYTSEESAVATTPVAGQRTTPPPPPPADMPETAEDIEVESEVASAETGEKPKKTLSKAFGQQAGIKAKEDTDAKVETNTRIIAGRVSDDTGLPLPGAAILVGGTTTGTQTDFDGNFQLEFVPGESDTLTVSYTGFETEKVVLSDTVPNVQVTMQADKLALEEVVVTGHTREREQARTAAVSNIDAFERYYPDELKYPPRALENKTEGRVRLSFLVGADGRPYDIRVERPLGDGCDEEAVRLLCEGPDWEPTAGEKRLRQVVRFQLPRD